MPLGDLRAELTLMARMALDELERERLLCRLVMREGDRFPELATRSTPAIVDRGHRIAIAWLQQPRRRARRELPDVEATARY